MKPALVDVSVLILFFNRPQQLSQVFEQVKKARPSRLFLYQDGARNERDLPGIEACREIVSQIDWECEVERLYQEKNFGCDPSEYISQKWAFSKVEKCIVLEDDDVPSVSFFRFCKEMLDKYEHDTRISMITGFNPEEITKDMPYDYFFATTFSIWGWASWRRVVDQWDEFYSFLDDSFNMRQLEQLIKERKFRSDFIYMCQRHREHQKAYYETIFHASILFGSGLSIVPARNMINNLGATADSTHFAGSVHTLPKGYRRIFTMKRYEVDFPLKHPRYVIENVAYKESVYRIMGWDHPWIKIGRSFEELFLNLRYGNFSIITKAVKPNKQMAEKKQASLNNPLTIYFYHTRLTRESYEEWKEYKFPGHILYGLPLLEKYGIRSVMHRYKFFPSRLKLMLYTAGEILFCKEKYDVLYATSFRG